MIILIYSTLSWTGILQIFRIGVTMTGLYISFSKKKEKEKDWSVHLTRFIQNWEIESLMEILAQVESYNID